MLDGFIANRIILPLFDAVLASDGLTRDDIGPLNVTGVAAGADASISGRTDAFLKAIHAPIV